MALSMQTEQFGITIPDTYIRVEQVLANIFEDGLECVARFYSSNPGPVAGTAPAFREFMFRVKYTPDGGDWFEQAYLGAKLLPEFETAVDC